MSYVTNRPLNLTNVDTMSGELKIKYNFQTKLENPQVKAVDDSDVSFNGIMIYNPPKNETVLNYNGKDYIFNYLAISKNLDKINYDDEDPSYCIAMVLSDIHYIEKLYIIQPILSTGGSSENTKLLQTIIDTGTGTGNITNFNYDLNNFIPNADNHFYYQYKTAQNQIVGFIVINESNFSIDTDKQDEITLPDTSYAEVQETSGTIYKMDTTPEKIYVPEEGEEFGDGIYIDCQPITDRDKTVHVTDPIRIRNLDMTSFFSLNKSSKVIFYIVLICVIFVIFFICSFSKGIIKYKSYYLIFNIITMISLIFAFLGLLKALNKYPTDKEISKFFK